MSVSKKKQNKHSFIFIVCTKSTLDTDSDSGMTWIYFTDALLLKEQSQRLCAADKQKSDIMKRYSPTLSAVTIICWDRYANKLSEKC